MAIYGAFLTENSKFRLLGDFFSRFRQHFSEVFGVKENDAVVRLALFIFDQKLEKFGDI